MHKTIVNLWREHRTFLLFILLMVMFRSALADWNSVPTGSMKPTIIEGDRIWVNKVAYDFRIPWTHISLIRHAEPKRGDIVVFDSARSEKRLVKRVIGMPGDTLSMRRNTLSINGAPLSYQLIEENNGIQILREQLGDRSHLIRLDGRIPAGLASFPPVTVPDGYYLVLGDNRNNSADSRVIGLVPRAEIIGRSKSVVMSLNYDNYYIPRSGRFFHTL